MGGPIETTIELVIESAAFERMVEIIQAPMTQPEIIPTIMPLVVGFVILELYFGKYGHKDSEWTIGLINSLLWIKIAISLILTESMETLPERYLSYGLLVLGFFTAYLNFNHLWRKRIAFSITSEFAAYTYAYLTVILVKTEIPLDFVTFQGSILFLTVIFVAASLIKLAEQTKIAKKSTNLGISK